MLKEKAKQLLVLGGAYLLGYIITFLFGVLLSVLTGSKTLDYFLDFSFYYIPIPLFCLCAFLIVIGKMPSLVVNFFKKYLRTSIILASIGWIPFVKWLGDVFIPLFTEDRDFIMAYFYYFLVIFFLFSLAFGFSQTVKANKYGYEFMLLFVFLGIILIPFILTEAYFSWQSF